MLYLFGYLLVVNIASYIIYFIDKQKAKSGSWRISEFTLVMFVVVGGGFGAIIAMKHFRHKTKKKKFTVLVPIITLITVILLLFVINEGIIPA